MQGEGSPLAVVQHRLLPVQLHHHARLVAGGQRVLELLAHALRHEQEGGTSALCLSMTWHLSRHHPDCKALCYL